MIAVAHHQAVAVLVPLGGELGDVGVDLGLQRLGQHPPRAFPHDLIDQRREPSLPASWPEPSPGTTVSIGLYLPGRRANAGHCLRPQLGSPGRYTPPRPIHRFQALLVRRGLGEPLRWASPVSPGAALRRSGAWRARPGRRRTWRKSAVAHPRCARPIRPPGSDTRRRSATWTGRHAEGRTDA